MANDPRGSHDNFRPPWRRIFLPGLYFEADRQQSRFFETGGTGKEKSGIIYQILWLVRGRGRFTFMENVGWNVDGGILCNSWLGRCRGCRDRWDWFWVVIWNRQRRLNSWLYREGRFLSSTWWRSLKLTIQIREEIKIRHGEKDKMIRVVRLSKGEHGSWRNRGQNKRWGCLRGSSRKISLAGTDDPRRSFSSKTTRWRSQGPGMTWWWEKNGRYGASH